MFIYSILYLRRATTIHNLVRFIALQFRDFSVKSDSDIANGHLPVTYDMGA